MLKFDRGACMNNRKGFGLLGMLISALIIGVLITAVLKQYTGRTRQALELPEILAPDRAAEHSVPDGKNAAGPGKQTGEKNAASAQAAPKCNGRLVGRICVPTEIRSSSLDAFEKYE